MRRRYWAKTSIEHTYTSTSTTLKKYINLARVRVRNKSGIRSYEWDLCPSGEGAVKVGDVWMGFVCARALCYVLNVYDFIDTYVRTWESWTWLMVWLAVGVCEMRVNRSVLCAYYTLTIPLPPASLTIEIMRTGTASVSALVHIWRPGG